MLIHLFEDYDGEDYSADNYILYRKTFVDKNSLEIYLKEKCSTYYDYRILTGDRWTDVKLVQHYHEVNAIVDKKIVDAYQKEHIIPTMIKKSEKSHIEIIYKES